jgi:hypothetical protein
MAMNELSKVRVYVEAYEKALAEADGSELYREIYARCRRISLLGTITRTIGCLE